MPKNPKIKYTLIRVEWVDSAQSGGWIFKEDIPFGCKIITSVGFLIKATEKYISLTAHISDIKGNDYQCCGVMCIPRSCIIKQEKING